MGLDYKFIPQKYLNCFLSEVFKNNRSELHSMDGRWYGQLEIFCSLMGLPEIPKRYCSQNEWFSLPLENISLELREKHFFTYRTDHHLSIDQQLARYDYFLDRHIIVGSKASKKETLKYSHWRKWGISKLENLCIEDVLSKKTIRRMDIYGDEETFNEIKSSILRVLNYYNKHYYIMAMV